MAGKYQQQAIQFYTGHEKFNKAMAAAKQLDNSLIKEYGTEGSTDFHFRIDQYLKYFSYEALNQLK